MSTLLQTTRDALGGDDVPACTSRALRLTRYARPTLEGIDRQNYLSRVVSAKDQRTDTGLKSWHAWLTAATAPEHRLHARLEARLLINTGGTVLENAGLQLDRFGTAYLPGSAVKACARRAALATLRHWCETGQKPAATLGDALAPACAKFDAPGDLLLAILRVFGCTDLEWDPYNPDKKSHDKNDLAWACGDDLPSGPNQWRALSAAAHSALNIDPGTDPAEAKPTRRGTVAFLPAYPISDKRPAADLELDVLTSHHPKYYSGKLATATDNENPIPVYFPAVAAQAVYTFALLPVGQSKAALLAAARIWLKIGLELFGLGAKTAAGYGYFTDATAEIAAKQAKESADKRRVDEESANKAKQAAELAAREEREARLASLTPAEREDAMLAELATDWGRLKPHLTKFTDRTPEQQAAILRWFAGAGKDRWLTEIKPDAAKGRKPWSQIIGAIHAAKKIHKIDLPA